MLVVMQKYLLIGFKLILVSLLVMGCAPRDWFLINSSGIMTYNRHTGQFELLWESKSPAVVIPHDSLKSDTIPSSYIIRK